MKFFVAFTALVAVAIASPVVKPQFSDEAQLEAIIAAIQSPNTDPATALLLEQQLQQIIAAASPIAVGPAIVETPIEPPGIAINPIVPKPPGIAINPIAPVPEPPGIAIQPPPIIDPSPVIVAPSPVEIQPTPVVVSPGPVAAPEASSAPLVQIILNINQEQVPSVVAETPVAPTPVVVVDEASVAPSPVVVVDEAPTPVVVVDQAPIIPEPVVLPTPQLPEVIPEPVVLPTPVLPEVVAPVEPVIVGTPVLPAPVINLPEILN